MTYTTNFSEANPSSFILEYYPNKDLPYGIIKAGETKKIRLRAYRGGWTGGDKAYLKVVGGLPNNELELTGSGRKVEIEATEYTESILNGTDPVLTSNLVPVNISDNGTVTKASTYDAWYEYGQRRWANAVVLINKTNYSDGTTIPESNIQSYFVWIPRYKYQIFNTGNYTGLGTLSSTAVQTINIAFENKSTAVSNGSSVNAWLTHPAFTSFNSNGFWVGKFESGYKGATSATGAEQNTSNYTNLIIKPNVYSWRGITVGNAFKVSYDYLRSDESHMMKNTEWGAVAYLQHSKYGSNSSVRINNNNSEKTGYAAVSEPTCGYNNNVSTSCNLVGSTSSVTVPYNTTIGYLASTTGNITGIYDMSGGSHDYVMGYNKSASTVGGESQITSLYSDFFTNSKWNKYYDLYTNNSTSETAYNIRILGDAIGEIGPFQNQKQPSGDFWPYSSWHSDFSKTITKSLPWVMRGGRWNSGEAGGIFFASATSGLKSGSSFRVILTP